MGEYVAFEATATTDNRWVVVKVPVLDPYHPFRVVTDWESKRVTINTGSMPMKGRDE